MKQDLAIFKAFSDETRLRILFLLSVRELCVCELVSVLDVPQGRISRHLAQLKNAGIVSDRRDGTWIYYSPTLSNTSLGSALQRYLKKDASTVEGVPEDRKRLDALADQGVVCVPRPVYTPASRSTETELAEPA